MGIFILLFTLLFVLYLATANDQQTRKSRILQTTICCILLVGIQGLRHKNIGIDTTEAIKFDIQIFLYGNLYMLIINF